MASEFNPDTKYEYTDGIVKNWEEKSDGSLLVWLRISKTGALQYGDKTEYVDSETLFNPNSINSLVGCSLLWEHPPTGFIRGLEDRKLHQRGCVLQEAVKEQLEDGSEALSVASIVFDSDLKSAITSGKLKEVSAAYLAKKVNLDSKVVQRERDYNHVVLTQKGRAGEQVKILLTGQTMPTEDKKGNKDSATVVETPTTTLTVETEESIRKRIKNEFKTAATTAKNLNTKFKTDVVYEPGDDITDFKKQLVARLTGKDSKRYTDAELSLILDVLPEPSEESVETPEGETEEDTSPLESDTSETSENTDSTIITVEPRTPKVPVDTPHTGKDGFPNNVLRSTDIAKSQQAYENRVNNSWKIGLPKVITDQY